MARSILSAVSLSGNDISSLAESFYVTFCYFREYDSPILPIYSQNLSTLLGLGFVAAFVEGEYLKDYQERLQVYQDYRDFIMYPDCLRLLACKVAEMISLGLEVFSILRYPLYFTHFAYLTEWMLSNMLWGIHGKMCEKDKEALLHLLEMFSKK